MPVLPGFTGFDSVYDPCKTDFKDPRYDCGDEDLSIRISESFIYRNDGVIVRITSVNDENPTTNLFWAGNVGGIGVRNSRGYLNFQFSDSTILAVDSKSDHFQYSVMLDSKHSLNFGAKDKTLRIQSTGLLAFLVLDNVDIA